MGSSKGRSSAIHGGGQSIGQDDPITAPATDAAKLWHGYGTALKPAYEPIVLAMKALDGTFAQNALKHGVAGLAIDKGRVGTEDNLSGGAYTSERQAPMTGDAREGAALGMFQPGSNAGPYQQPQGRWPANVIHDGSEEVVGMFPSPHGAGYAKANDCKTSKNSSFTNQESEEARNGMRFGDSGSAARFFYTAKASKADRGYLPAEDLPLFGIKDNAGLDGSEVVIIIVAWENEVHKVRLRVVTERSRPKVIAVSGVPEQNPTAWNRLLFGSNTTAPYLKGCRYTTRMATSSTTTSATWNFLTQELTSGCTADVLSGTGLSTSPAESAGELTLLTSITSEKTASLLGAAPAASKTLLQISASESNCGEGRAGKFVNFHATVKPLALMEYLLKLITMPERNLILDPFAGSGTTLVACKRLGLPCIGIELNEEYAEIAAQRLDTMKSGSV